jgi:hypothetical protein
LLARQAIELRVETAGGELTCAFPRLSAFPPLGILRRLGNRLRTRFCFADLGFFTNLGV